MAEKKQADTLHFWKIYSLVGSSRQLMVDKNVTKVCRFCTKKEPAVSFKMEAHALPELLGGNDWISDEECDTCNNFFSGFESHLSKFFLPYLSLVQVKGKKKIPEFQSRTENNNEITRTSLKSDASGKFQLIVGQNDDLVIDHKKKQVSMRFRLPPHKPFYVYKSLVKIGLSILQPELVGKYRTVFEWLMGNDVKTAYFPMVFITKVIRHKFARPFAELYEANRVFKERGFYPELTLVINFGNLVAQIFMPLSSQFDYERSDQKSPQLEIYPACILYNFEKERYKDSKPTDLITVDYKFDSFDLSSNESCIRDETIGLSFQDIQTHKQ